MDDEIIGCLGMVELDCALHHFYRNIHVNGKIVLESFWLFLHRV